MVVFAIEIFAMKIYVRVHQTYTRDVASPKLYAQRGAKFQWDGGVRGRHSSATLELYNIGIQNSTPSSPIPPPSALSSFQTLDFCYRLCHARAFHISLFLSFSLLSWRACCTKYRCTMISSGIQTVLGFLRYAHGYCT